MGVAVQFWGKERTVTAYEYAACPCWAIFSQRNILTSFDGDTVEQGAQSLEQFIDMLSENSSDGVYQLRMYKDPRGEISNATPYNASFHFRLAEQDPELRGDPLNHTYRAINERLDKIESRIIEEVEAEPEIPAWQQTLGAVIGKPEFQQLVLEKIVGLIRGLFAGRQDPQGAGPAGATVGSVPDEVLQDGNTLYNLLPPEQKIKLDQAMPVLMSKDPEIGDNLLKIAHLLQTNPDKYRMFAAML